MQKYAHMRWYGQDENAIDDVVRQRGILGPRHVMLAVLQERERDSMAELEEAKQQAQTATHAFNAVRQARFDTFMQAFNHISEGIDRIFKVSCLYEQMCPDSGFGLLASFLLQHFCLQVCPRGINKAHCCLLHIAVCRLWTAKC